MSVIYTTYMRLYITHATSYDYKTELYKPLKEMFSQEYEFIFPHDESNVGKNSKGIIEKSDTVIAEVSFPSTGQGIELGWANILGVPIICLYRSGAKPSGALQLVATHFIEYGSSKEMTEELLRYFENKI